MGNIIILVIHYDGIKQGMRMRKPHYPNRVMHVFMVGTY